MSLAQQYFEDWIGYWTYVSQRTMESWSGSTRKLRSRTDEYKVQNIFGDAMDYWTDITMASLSAWRGPETRPQTVVFYVDTGDDCTGSRCMRVPVFAQRLPHKEAHTIWMGYISGQPGKGMIIDESDLKAHYFPEKGELEIKLLDLRRHAQSEGAAKGAPAPSASPSLAPGTYRALVHVGDVPLAEVFVVVEDLARRNEPGAPTSARRKKKTKGKLPSGGRGYQTPP